MIGMMVRALTWSFYHAFHLSHTFSAFISFTLSLMRVSSRERAQLFLLLLSSLKNCLAIWKRRNVGISRKEKQWDPHLDDDDGDDGDDGDGDGDDDGR